MMIPTRLIAYGVGAAAIVGGVWLYGNHQYREGVAHERAETQARQMALAQAQQEAADRREAEYRGAILAREAEAKRLTTELANTSGMLNATRRKLQASGTCPRLDAAGTDDWIGILAESWTEYSDMAKEAGRLSDKVTGLQGYIKAVTGPHTEAQ